jgi:hypothetical protein
MPDGHRGHYTSKAQLSTYRDGIEQNKRMIYLNGAVRRRHIETGSLNLRLQMIPK